MACEGNLMYYLPVVQYANAEYHSGSFAREPYPTLSGQERFPTQGSETASTLFTDPTAQNLISELT